MSQLLAERIRHHLTPPGHWPGPGATAAVLAVLDVCEQMRPIRVGPSDEPVGHYFADGLEQTIARAVGIEVDR
ncbi:hypothetical protein AMIS_20070 [Actinoplanes missouriensis 431]|uniref:Uncharacterized protein n=1 Tax=Actinoplanes missouriensis (strain ATCC 14538 / DSM 43046 / CBS 188.64 / JCM 3121 / NBRC 102363 / NCIMB 12654 / NRRL B-3342 / UNCC 431) TaxID=512565 RepID=I0H2J0_ACTM4|nr:hypothetical protein [Actinoplanes missouriensis]BAL87227.1 hypothetical protein AMIS_20070 [Actinoplanes missouriensis 431]